jgi:DedD protein
VTGVQTCALPIFRIPGQDDKPFTPSLAPVSEPVASAAAQPANAPSVAPVPAVPVSGALAGMAAERQNLPAANPPKQAAPEQAVRPEKVPSAVDKPTSEKTASKPTPAEKPAAKTPPRPEGLAETPAVQDDEARRAAAILAGRSPDAKAPAASAAAAAAGSHVILIGAFSNEGNVRTLKSKLGEQGIKVYTEPLDTPQGRKTRVRAGPFPSRDAAEAALKKMQRIGVSGVVSAKP